LFFFFTASRYERPVGFGMIIVGFAGMGIPHHWILPWVFLGRQVFTVAASYDYCNGGYVHIHG
jgi:hypothetical protein